MISEAEQESPGMPRAGRMRRGKARRRRVLTEEYSEEPQRRHGASGWLAGAGGFLLSLSLQEALDLHLASSDAVSFVPV